MPAMLFHVRWPDAVETRCYSPSLVVRDYLTVDTDYPLDDFLRRITEALGIASERVREKYGFSCSHAQDQLLEIEHRAAAWKDPAAVQVRVLAFSDVP